MSLFFKRSTLSGALFSAFCRIGEIFAMNLQKKLYQRVDFVL